MAVLYLQGGGQGPRSGVGRLVHEVDWPRGLVAPVLDAEWLAQPFQRQLECVDEWLAEVEAVVGFGWGGHLLLCALEGAASIGRPVPPGLFLSCFFNKGQFTGRGGAHYRLPRSEKVREALTRGGVLSDCEFRFLHGEKDAIAPAIELKFLKNTPFSVQEVPAGHLLRGPGEDAVRTELQRLRRGVMALKAHSGLVESPDCG